MLHPRNQERLSAYFDGELSAAEAREMERLLRDDSAARAWWEHLVETRSQLEALPTFRLPTSFADEVLRRAEREMLVDSPEPRKPLAAPYCAPGSAVDAAETRTAALGDTTVPAALDDRELQQDETSQHSSPADLSHSTPPPTLPAFAAFNPPEESRFGSDRMGRVEPRIAAWRGALGLATAASLLLMAGVLFSDTPHRGRTDSFRRAQNVPQTEAARFSQTGTHLSREVRLAQDAQRDHETVEKPALELATGESPAAAAAGEVNESGDPSADAPSAGAPLPLKESATVKDRVGETGLKAAAWSIGPSRDENSASLGSRQRVESLAYMHALPQSAGVPRVVVLDVEQEALAKVERALGLRPASELQTMQTARTIPGGSATYAQPQAELLATSQPYTSGFTTSPQPAATARVYFVSLPPAEWASAIHEVTQLEANVEQVQSRTEDKSDDKSQPRPDDRKKSTVGGDAANFSSMFDSDSKAELAEDSRSRRHANKSGAVKQDPSKKDMLKSDAEKAATNDYHAKDDAAQVETSGVDKAKKGFAKAKPDSAESVGLAAGKPPKKAPVDETKPNAAWAHEQSGSFKSGHLAKRAESPTILVLRVRAARLTLPAAAPQPPASAPAESKR